MNHTLEEGIEIYPNIVYFNDDHSRSPKCTGTLSDLLKATWSMPSTWHELAQELEKGAENLVFHVDMIAKSIHSTPAEFIDAINVITSFIPNSKPLRISVIITTETPLSTIRLLQKTGIQGISLDINYYSVEQVATAVNALVNGIPFWPKDIISKLPTGRPLSIYFRGDWEEYKHTFDLPKLEKIVDMDLAYCSSWDQLDEALAKSPHQLIFQITELERIGTTISEIVSMMKTRLKIHGVDIPMAVGIVPYTTTAQIKELKRAGIHGIIPNAADWGIHDTITAMHALRDRIPHWPKHILDQLPGAVKKKPNADKIILTHRQEQVFKFITERGASNKVIAKSLGLSESTVKLHITEIFKKYGVRSRTQLAVFSNAS